MDILDLLRTALAGPTQKTKGSGFGSLAKMAIPFILMSIFKNLQDKKQGESFTEALKDHESKLPPNIPMHDVFRERVEKADQADGGKILSHILGKDTDHIVGSMAEQLGIRPQEALEMISKLTPSIMEMLAEKTRGNRDLNHVQETVGEQLSRVDQTEGMPNLPPFIRDLLSGKKETPQGGLLESLGGFESLKDLLGGLLK